MDIFQRNLEYDQVCRFLERDMTILEVGCGNGFSTNRFRELVRHIDAFDLSEAMIARARETYGERNNRFIHDNVLAPQHLGGAYDAVLCIRVLINLRDLPEQRLAIRNMTRLVKEGGRLIVVEGFCEGFRALSALRVQLGLPPLQPAAINVYSELTEIAPELDSGFDTEARFHLGAYDYLTRVVYPLIVGADRVRHNTFFSERCSELARVFNPESFAEFSRVHGFVLRRRA